jgi:hypothetical protein
MTRWRRLTTTITLTAALTAALLGLNPAQQVSEADAATYEGFGAAATGGAGQTIYQVTRCDDNKDTPVQGMLRHASLQGNRTIVFDVACGPGSPNPLAIFATTWIYFRSNTTVDGTTAPAPGFQYLGTLAIGGQKCSPRCNNVIIRGMIYRPDGRTITNFALKIERGAHTIVFDHNTFEGCGNDCIGISSDEGSDPTTYVDSHNITISRNLFNHPFRIDPGAEGTEYGASTAALFTQRSRRISFIYNLIYDSGRRNPRVSYDPNVNPTDTVIDVRNNVMYDIVGGTGSQDGGVILYDNIRANVVNNYLKATSGLPDDSEKKVILICKPSGAAPEDGSFCGTRADVEKVYVSGNISANGWSVHINTKGTTGTPQAAAAVTTLDACAAAQSVGQDVGAPYKNINDRAALNDVTLTECSFTPIQPPESLRIIGK